MKSDQSCETKLRKRCKWLRWSPQASEALLEGLIELVGILVLGGIGWGVVTLVGVGADHWNVDFETLVIIGGAVLVVLGVTIWLMVKLWKKISKKIQKRINQKLRGDEHGKDHYL